MLKLAIIDPNGNKPSTLNSFEALCYFPIPMFWKYGSSARYLFMQHYQATHH